MTQSGPLRLHLAMELRKFRSATGLTQLQVAKQMDWSPSKVIRIEKGEVRVAQTDLLAMLKLYDVTDQEIVDDLTADARESKRLPFTQYRGVVSDETLQLLQLEIGASIIRHVALNVLPGTMQTDGYARAILNAFDVEPDRAERMLDARRERRALLEREDGPEFFVVVDESALRRTVGDGQVMAEQIDHLVDLSRRAHITIQVLPFSLGAHAALPGSFIHLEFPEGGPPETVYVENPLGDSLFQHDEAVTKRYRERFQALEKIASPYEDFARFVTT